ncbi:hypothetical protein ACM66B_000544 [Microbotryomycetes sp. NB124-2]
MSTSTTVDAATFPNPWAEPLTAPVDKLNTYICVMPDLEPSNRLNVRPVHLVQSAEGRKIGWIINAGPFFKGEAGTEMAGSYYLLREQSLEKARERLSRDVYSVHGAWDMSKASIHACGVSK